MSKKQLCDLKKSLKGDIGSYMDLVTNPTHICTKCGRAANSKKLLCKPLAIVSCPKKSLRDSD